MTLQLPLITLGTMAHTSADANDARIALIQRALESGIGAIDTAPLYEFGECERLVGRAIAGQREQVKILSKVGLRWSSDARGEVLFETPDHRVHRDSRPEMIRRDVEESLERLGVEHLDLVQVHQPDPHTPMNETFGALADQHHQGRVGAIGASNFSVEQLEQARKALHPIPLLSSQERYSLLYRDVERNHVPYCLKHDIHLLCYSPLAQGLLAGKLLSGGHLSQGDFRACDPTFHPKNLTRIHEAMRKSLEPIATAHDATLAAIALRWLMQQPAVVTVICGVRNEAQLNALIRAQSLTLTNDEQKMIHNAFPTTLIDRHAGHRLIERAMHSARRKVARLMGR